jgi:hypothetical protein
VDLPAGVGATAGVLVAAAARLWYPALRVVAVRERSRSAARKSVKKFASVFSASAFFRQSFTASPNTPDRSTIWIAIRTADASVMGSSYCAKVRHSRIRVNNVSMGSDGDQSSFNLLMLLLRSSVDSVP